MAIIEGYEELGRKIDSISADASYCKFARKLSEDMIYGNDEKTFQEGVVVCKRKIGSISVHDYTCTLKRIKFNKGGGLEAECSWFGNKNPFNFKELARKPISEPILD